MVSNSLLAEVILLQSIITEIFIACTTKYVDNFSYNVMCFNSNFVGIYVLKYEKTFYQLNT